MVVIAVMQFCVFFSPVKPWLLCDKKERTVNGMKKKSILFSIVFPKQQAKLLLTHGQDQWKHVGLHGLVSVLPWLVGNLDLGHSQRY